MANNVLNRIKIKGDKEDIADFLQKCAIDDNGEKVFSFNQFIPMPENPIPNWYNWSMEHWGTKWDARDSAVIELDDGDLELYLSRHGLARLLVWKKYQSYFQT